MAEDFDAIIEAATVTETEAEFVVRGKTYKVRVPVDAAELLALEQQVAPMMKAAEKRPDLAKWLPTTPYIMRVAVFLNALSIDPRITTEQALRTAKTCRMLLPEIGNGLLTAMGVDETEDAEIEAEGNA